MRKTFTINMCLGVCLTSTKTDTAALTKMMRKSFTLQSSGTQTIYKVIEKGKERYVCKISVLNER